MGRGVRFQRSRGRPMDLEGYAGCVLGHFREAIL